MTHTQPILRSYLVKSPLIAGATVAALIASASMAPAFTPVVFAPMAFSWMAIQNIQARWFCSNCGKQQANDFGNYTRASGPRTGSWSWDANGGQGGYVH
jgi:hypothetical protein